MKRTMILTAMTTVLAVSTTLGGVVENDTLTTEGPERTLERQMLSSIDFVEEDEEVDLGFDTYFYLPFGFNPYEGMEFDLNEIEYIELHF